MKNPFHFRVNDVTRPWLVLSASLLAVVCLDATMRHAYGVVTWSLALAPMVGVLAWQAHRRVGALHDYATGQADTAAETEQHYFSVLVDVVKLMEGQGHFAVGRSDRIARLAEQMGRHAGMDAKDAKLLGMVARVHDIGLLSVPQRVMEKPTGLRGQEFQAVKRHCELGHSILERLTFLAPMLPAVLHHHERLNGTGYPRELAGDEIPLSARILAVADSYEAMTHDRPHRRALTASQAVGELSRCAGSGYDGACVVALAEAVNVELSDENRRTEAATVAMAVPRLVG